MGAKKDTSLFLTAMSNAHRALLAIGLFSTAVNLLMLTGPLFMLQVYDRVLASRSMETLGLLFGLVCVLYLFLVFFDFSRARVLSRTAYKFDQDLMPLAQKVRIHQGIASVPVKSNPVQDLTMVRQFIGSNAPSAFFDLPWVPLYLGVVFLFHFWLGVLATAAVVVVVILTLINELAARKPLKESMPYEFADGQLGQQVFRNADAIVSMGMARRLIDLWSDTRNRALMFSQKAGGVSEIMTSFTKGFRLLIQSAILTLGAYLAILQEITPGVMIAASIVAGRALAPIDQVVGSWRHVVRSRLAFNRLKMVLGGVESGHEVLELPVPKGEVTVRELVKLPSSGLDGLDLKQKPILQGIGFKLEPGDGLGVVGPSASGKSTLARLLVGLWRPDRGTVQLDGATYDLWDKEQLGQYIGYLPQDVELIAGTVRQNISRFDPEADSAKIVAAAKLAGVHQIILDLPDGYDAPIGGEHKTISGGQAQRIALARAVYGKPPLIVLDEPNSNLDTEGDMALTNCINELREAGSTVIVMAHRPSAIAAVNKILMLNGGRQVEFGTKEEVLQKVQRMTVVANAG